MTFDPLPEPDGFPDTDSFPTAPSTPTKPSSGGPVDAAIVPASERIPEPDLPAEILSPINPGDIIQLADPESVAFHLDEARRFKRETLDPYINGLERVVTRMGRTAGTATLRAGEWELTVTKKRDYRRDLESIRVGLIEAGCPVERVNEVIKQTISLSATTQDLDRLAKANEEYRAVIDEHTTVIDKEPGAAVKRMESADS